MAALEKIRKRAAILTIVIGAGLLAFILEEAVRASGAFRMDTMALQVGDEKIDIQQFSNYSGPEQEKLQKRYQEADQKPDDAELQQVVVRNLINEKIIEQECNDAHFDVTNDEVLTVLFEETGLDTKTFEQIKNAQPKQNPTQQEEQVLQYKNLLEARVQEIAKELKRGKINLAVTGCIKPNKLEEKLINEYNTQYEVEEYAMIDYNQYAQQNSNAPECQVSPDEIKEAYKQFKEFFKIDQEQRHINFIMIDLLPSDNDTKDAKNKINKINNDFASKDGILGIKNNNDISSIDSLCTDSKRKDLVVNGKNQPEPKDSTFINLLAGGINYVGEPKQDPRDPNTYYLYKVTKVVPEFPDSICLNSITISGSKETSDTILAKLNSGELLIESIKADDPNIANIEIFDKNSGSKPINGLNFIYNNNLQDSIKAHFNDRKFFVADQVTQGDKQFTTIIQIVGSSEPVTLYSVARAKYKITPSAKTVNNVREKLETYVNNNKTAADFKKNAKDYKVQECVVDNNTPYIYSQATGGIPGTRGIIKWAFENKPGAVSELNEIEVDGETKYLVVAALEDVYKDYKPYTDPEVNQVLKTYIRNKKIGEALTKKCNGINSNNVDDYAEKLTVNNFKPTVQHSEDGQPITLSLMNIQDPKVIGRLTGLGKKAEGKISVIAGDNVFYVIKVKAIKPAEQMPNNFIASFYRGNMAKVNPEAIMWSSRKIFNNTLKLWNKE